MQLRARRTAVHRFARRVAIRLRIGRETRLRPDDRATLLLDATAIQLFDAATTRVIARGRA